MRIANVISDSIVDGPGLRFTIFTQGCPHHCPGCHNPATHAFDGGEEASLAQLAQMWEGNPLLQGITLSGGEPFCQAAECAQLARLARKKGLDVWCYTGYTYEELVSARREDYARLLSAIDVLVDGRFVLAERSYGIPFRGSRNQRLINMAETRRTGRMTLWERPDPLAKFTVPES